MKSEQTPETIEHNINEKRPPKWIWKVGFAAIGILWILQARRGFDWEQIMLAFGTGVLFVSWVADRFGLDVPASWRSKPPRG